MSRMLNHAETKVLAQVMAVAGTSITDHMAANPSESLEESIRAVIDIANHRPDAGYTEEDIERLYNLAHDAHDAKTGLLI